ncbi:hypothetical protein GCM10009097_04060 [Pigmentiphaga daeguensis]|uniref:Uncharacterized protein n=1 Tax=Pigmentiphaga daeguensis TaxID=414049 RepID=A0ABP3L1V0_9BURK
MPANGDGAARAAQHGSAVCYHWAHSHEAGTAAGNVRTPLLDTMASPERAPRGRRGTPSGERPWRKTERGTIPAPCPG